MISRPDDTPAPNIDRASTWVQDHVGPWLDELSATCSGRDERREMIPRDVFRTREAVNLLRVPLPRELGGLGCDVATWGAVLEQVGRQCEDGSLALALSLYPSVAMMVAESGRQHLIDRYARRLADGSSLLAFAFTEDADPLSLASRYRESDGTLVVNGSKTIIGGGMMADGFMVYAVDDATEELGVLIVETSDEGVSLEPVATVGLRSAGFARLVMRDVRIPKDRVLCPDNGLTHAQRFLNLRRTIIASSAVGRMARTIRIAVEHLQGTVRHGQALASLGAVQAKLGNMRVELESARAIIRSSLEHIDEREQEAALDDYSAAAKIHCTRALIQISLWAYELMGGAGFMTSCPIERYIRDSLGLIPGAGAQDILQANLGVKTLFDPL